MGVSDTNDMREAITAGLSREMIESLGDVAALLEIVLLELESRREVERVPASDRRPVGSKYRRAI